MTALANRAELITLMARQMCAGNAQPEECRSCSADGCGDHWCNFIDDAEAVLRVMAAADLGIVPITATPDMIRAAVDSMAHEGFPAMMCAAIAASPFAPTGEATETTK